MNRFRAAVVLIGLLGATATCWAQVTIFSSLGSDNSSVNGGYPVCGTAACGGGNFIAIGARFQAAATATLTSIALPLGYAEGTNSITIGLWTDNSAVPGSSLETWTVTNVPVFSTNSQALTTLVSNLNLTLTAGQFYWVTAQVPSDTAMFWNESNQNVLGIGTNFGDGWSYIPDAPMVALGVQGNGSSGSGLSCTAFVANQPVLRQEGATEPAGDILASCSGMPVGSQTGPQTLTLTLNAPVTSRQLYAGGAPSNIPTEAALLVNDNVTSSTVNGASPPSQGLLENGALVFSNFTIPSTGSPFTIRLTNVRVNANAVGSGSFVTGNLSSSLPIQNNSNLVLGAVQGSLGVAVSSAPTFIIGQLQNQNISSLTIGELVNTAFRSPAVLSGNNPPGAWYQSGINTESQTPLAASLPNWINQLGSNPGTADSATRVRVNLSQIPSGVTVMLPVTVTAGTSQLVANQSGDIGPFNAVTGNSIALTGAGSVTYEVRAQSPSAIDSFTIPMQVNFSGTPGAGTALVSATYAPTTAEVTNSNPLFGIPRFADTSVLTPLFTVSATQGCSYSLTPTGASVVAGASRGSVSVTAPSGCNWTASNNSLTWATITGGSSGSGNGTVSYSIAANPNSGDRSGSLTIAGQSFPLSQAGQGCQVGFNSPGPASLPLSGSAGSSFAVNLSGADCQWTSSTNVPSWVNITSGTNGTGSGNVTYTVASNAASSVGRSGAITINVVSPIVTQAVFNITEAGSTCSYSLTQSSRSFTFAGGGGSFSVVAPGGCAWSVSSSVPWVSTLVGGSGNGAGNGTVSYTVQTNTSNTARSATLTIATQSYVITQGPASSTLSCLSSVPTVPQVALEGRTEVVGNLVLSCTGLTGAITADVILTLNTSVTNQVTSGISDALLTTGSAKQGGQVLGYTTVHWPGVTLTPISGVATVTISNVKADASQLSAVLNPAITGALSVNSSVAVPIPNASQTLATAAPALAFQANPTTTNSGLTTLPLIYQENAPGLFHIASSSGPATRLRMAISNVPSGVQVYAPVGGTQYQLLSTDCSGGGGAAVTTGTTLAGATYSPLTATGGVATATWVILTGDSGSLETLTIPLLLQNPNGVSLNAVQVVGSVAPVSPAGAACAGASNLDPSSAAVPRYRDFSVPQTLVNLRLTTSLTVGTTQTGSNLRVAQPQLLLKAALKTSPLGVGSSVPFTFGGTLSNESASQPLTHGSVGGSVPSGSNQMSLSATGGGTCSQTGSGTYNCTWPTVPAGQSVSYTGVTQVDQSYGSGSTLTNAASANGDQQPADPTTVESSSSQNVPTWPVITITGPANAATVGQVVTIGGWSAGLNNSISSVTIQVDNSTIGTATLVNDATDCANVQNFAGCTGFTFTTSPLSIGTHMITASVLDTHVPPLLTVTNPITVTVSTTGAGRNPVMVMRDGVGSIRLGVYPSATLSNSGGIFASDPSAAQDAAGNTFVTARDKFNSVWANVYTTGGLWAGWTFGGGIIQGVPSIAVDTTGKGWIASRDTFNSYWLVSYSIGGSFGNWVPLAGIFSTDPVVTSCSDGSIYVIGKDTFNSIWSGRYIPSAATPFQGWQFGGAIISGKPSATCGSDNAVYVAGEDNFRSNWIARVSGNSWGNWFFGGAITSVTPRIAAMGNGSEAVMILDTTGVVYQTTYTEGTANGWQPWTEVGGVLTDVEPAVGAPGNLYLAGEASNGLWWWKQSGNAWTGIGNAGVSQGLLAAAPK